jgi:glycosyltransferase involved in cell wall biosynthesis
MVALTYIRTNDGAGMKLLLVGPKSPPVGGTTVLFEELCEYIDNKSDVELGVISSSPVSVGRTPFAIALFLLKIFFQVRKYDVTVLHASSTSMVLVTGFVLRIATAVFSKKMAFRGFGGRFPIYWKQQSWLKKALIKRGILAADVLFFETKESVTFVQSLTNAPIKWFPNSRSVNVKPTPRTGPAKKFVFISHVKPSKGIRVLLEAAKTLNNVEIDVYGAMQEGITEQEFDGSLVSYKGELTPEVVQKTLRQYDVLLLPTFYKGEGYPGIILEAYIEAMPIITTRWRCIPEIADESCALLLTPENAQELGQAIKTLSKNQELVDRLRVGSAEKALSFSSDKWGGYFLETLKALS